MVNLPTVQSYKYPGSTIDRRGGASKDVDNRVTKTWSKWRELSGVICDKKIPTKLKILIYQTVIRPTLLYGCETWPMSVTEKDGKVSARPATPHRETMAKSENMCGHDGSDSHNSAMQFS